MSPSRLQGPERAGTRTDRSVVTPRPTPTLREVHHTKLFFLGQRLATFNFTLSCATSPPFFLKNRQVLNKYPTSEDEKGLGNSYQQNFHGDTRQRRNLVAFVLLVNTSRSQGNLKSYKPLYSEFTPLPPNLLKCPCHLMSTHNHS